MTEKIIDFLSRSKDKRVANEWLETNEGKVYLRWSFRYIKDDKVRSIEVASIEASRPRTGFFTKVIEVIEEHTDAGVIILENAHNPILQNWAVRHKWELLIDDPTYYKKIRKEQ